MSDQDEVLETPNPGGTKPFLRNPKNGHFVKGTAPSSRGNPYISKMKEYQHAVRNAVTPKDLELVLRKLLAMALRGDVKAAKLVLDRTVGRIPVHVLLEGDVNVSDDKKKLAGISPEGRVALQSLLESELRKVAGIGSGSSRVSHN